MNTLLEITLTTRAYADDSKKRIRVIFELEDGSIALSIWNNGSKFSDDVLKNFGKLFYREDISRNSQFEHFGIGLAFVKQVMSIHSGDIQLQNKEKGAMVKLIIPIKNSDLEFYEVHKVSVLIIIISKSLQLALITGLFDSFPPFVKSIKALSKDK